MDETKVLKSLANKHDVRVQGTVVKVLNGLGKTKPKNDLGNGSWGKIDFLVNHLNYRLLSVPEL